LVAAVKSDPENYWFLRELVKTHYKQGYNIKLLEDQIPIEKVALKLNLAKILLKTRQYQLGLSYLKSVPKSKEVTNLKAKLEHELSLVEKRNQKRIEAEAQQKAQTAQNPLTRLKEKLKTFEQVKDYQSLLVEATTALESYPAQADFYYLQGLAYNQLKQYKQATEALELALEFIIDNKLLQTKVYLELVTAYNALGKTKKAEEYIKKNKAIRE
jgi:tetratricopeptide (TPR) repeat protein